MRLIDVDALLMKKFTADDIDSYDTIPVDEIVDAPTIDAVPVIRCRDCAFYKPRHIKLNDGSEREYLPGEGLVSIAVGINVGGQCMVDEGRGYDGDKSVFRGENDFCSRGIRKLDAEVEG